MTAADLHACIVERYNVTNGMANCPAHDDRTPSLSVTLDGDRVLVYCHAGCSQVAVLDAMRRDGVWPEVGAGLGRYIEPVLSPAPETPVSYPWWSPDRHEPAVQVRPGRNGRKYDWPAGTKAKRLLFPGPVPAGSGPIIVAEGAKASIHATRKSGLPAVAIVSESIIPDGDVLRDAGLPGREVWLWPDVEGEAVMNRLAARLVALGCTVWHLHPDVLGLRSHGEDAEQWQPGSDPVGELRGALRAHAAEPATSTATGNMRLLLADDDDTENPKALIPGLLWEGCVSLITSAPKSGKTTLIADGLSRLYTGEAWLSERCEGDRQRPILVWQEMPIGILRAWVRRHGVDREAPIYAAPMETVDQVLATVEKLRPQAIVIDSLTDLSAASDAGDMWRGADMRRLINGLRSTGCGALVVHHVRKSDGAARDSSDIPAAVDIIVAFDGGQRSGEAPPSDQTRRRLTYRGRWQEQTRHLEYDPDTGRYSLVNGPDDDDSGPLVPGTGHGDLDNRIKGYLMRHPEGVSGRQVCKAVSGRDRTILDRLEVVGKRGDGGLWRVLPDAADPYVGQHRQHRCPKRCQCCPTIRTLTEITLLCAERPKPQKTGSAWMHLATLYRSRS